MIDRGMNLLVLVARCFQLRKFHALVFKHVPSGWDRSKLQKLCVKARPTDDNMDNPNNYITTNCEKEDPISLLESFYVPTSKEYKATHCTSFDPPNKRFNFHLADHPVNGCGGGHGVHSFRLAIAGGSQICAASGNRRNLSGQLHVSIPRGCQRALSLVERLFTVTTAVYKKLLLGSCFVIEGTRPEGRSPMMPAIAKVQRNIRKNHRVVLCDGVCAKLGTRARAARRLCVLLEQEQGLSAGGTSRRNRSGSRR